MDDDAIWRLEERFWTGGAEHYAAALHPGCVMAFPAPVGILSGPSIGASLAGAPRWASVEMSERAVTRAGTAAVALGYRALGRREGAEPYDAFCTSTYAATAEGWKLIQHQQTPVSSS
jgi:hypothetical protein